MSLVKVRLFVTDKDTYRGVRCNGDACMAARAISRKLKDGAGVRVGCHSAYYYLDGVAIKTIAHSKFLAGKIYRWDDGHKVNRFNCMIEIPAECLK